MSRLACRGQALSHLLRASRTLTTSARVSPTAASLLQHQSQKSPAANPRVFAARRLATKADTLSANYARVYDPAQTVGYDKLDTFARRHFGPTPQDVQHMLGALGYTDLDAFLTAAIPPHVLAKRPLKVEPQEGYTELSMLEHLHGLALQNRIAKSFIGKGYAGTHVPPVIQRNLLELPEWYTSYTPYQPEISQGRLESLLNYQTMVCSLTGLDMANASLLDEGTAAAEAMAMSFHNLRGKKHVYAVDANVHPQTLAVLRSRAANIGLRIAVLPLSTPEGVAQLDDMAATVCGALVQYPATDGLLHDFSAVGEVIHSKLKGLFAVATDLLALTLLKPPSEIGADIALGNSQRFGVPFGYGGPHAAFFATTQKFSRKMPGRIVGVSKDRLGKPALRLALQTREQHIKREKATSNICTAQALLANMAAMYAVYHGPQGLKNIASRVYGYTRVLADIIETSSPHTLASNSFFDTLTINLEGVSADNVLQLALDNYNINLFKVDASTVSLTFDETVTQADLESLVVLFTGKSGISLPDDLPCLPEHLLRTDAILPNEVFNSHHSETSMLRYLHLLQTKDLSLANSMIPLGSCTMKLNATVEMQSLSMPGFSQIHPFAPTNQALGYKAMIAEFEKDLNDITGFAATTLMPNSGAQGEYTGLSLIREYFKAHGEYEKRNVCLIPVSAHGTNPASAAMCGLKVVPVKCLENGLIDVEELKIKAEKHKDNLCAIMLTYPSTYGLFEPGVRQSIDIVHENGGLVYLDGANMNAQVGLTSPGDLGADVCHLNIHKTFALSHGGGGPGQGPVCVAERLIPYLPAHPFVDTPHATSESIEAVNSAPFGSAAVIPVSYSYIKMLGAKALPYASSLAILNANYMLTRLQDSYSVMFIDATASKEEGTKHCGHEFIIDLREFKAIGIEAIDVAKRLQDYGFHAPTMSFPVSGTLMIEPTESENLEELDRFVEAMLSIRKEIDAHAKGEPLGKVLKNAPHSLEDVISTSQEEWQARGYSREQAAYPLPELKKSKCWPSVARLDDTYGDMNLICTCPSVEDLAEE
ncbi:glycine cleavage system protein [Metschnikowia bicuspidata var. bicuspidata NRRL YB-4993]|uniref:Glycine cleavage system P protein n=1 Tax=Metschnikowia bicuspidata var. bicuspidata NRRL YB-4993 TaxID=869754 RepID=A0A1A0HF00_9ASCO|nr:glycine cleavage system protein [Metschnikowia bicuspidata var. bicuspidata NRRL YB-4993]OBA22555.1 glycine cleavage system protein [Metschnikowia bicuspidata var. bicuspidata NRRL YB-4993]